MKKLTIPGLTGGLNTKTRPDLLQDGQVVESWNMEMLQNGRLTRRRDPGEYDTKLTAALDTAFDTIIKIGAIFYPPARPDDMTNDFILLVYGLDGADYELKAFYEDDADLHTWTATALTGLTSAGIVYSSDSVLRFAVADNRVIITDYEGDNIAHYFTVDHEGDITAGPLGIPAPKTRAVLAGTGANEYIETNMDAQYLCVPALIQAVYTVVTKEGDESNPAPISNTLEMQYIKYDKDRNQAQNIDKIEISNLTIPPDLSTDIKRQLKHFKIYLKIHPYSVESFAPAFQYSQTVEIIEKSATSDANTYSVATPPINVNPGYEKDIAPIAKYPLALANITLLANVKQKIKFPDQFANFAEIILNNNNNQTYIDAIIRIRIYDGETTNADKITGLDFTTTTANTLRLYKNDLTTPLPVVYEETADGAGYYRDIYVKIPDLTASTPTSIYLCWGGTGVATTAMQTPANGEWVPLSGWASQKVFTFGERVNNSQTRLVMNQDVISGITQIVNKADENFKNTEVSTTPTTNNINILPVFSTKYLGKPASATVKFDAAAASLPFGYSGLYSSITNYPVLQKKGYIYARIKYAAADLGTATGDNLIYFISAQDDDTNAVNLELNLEYDTASGTDYYFNIVAGANSAQSTLEAPAATANELFLLMSWDIEEDTVYLAFWTAADGWNFEEVSVDLSDLDDPLHLSSAGLGAGKAIPNLEVDQINFTEGTYLSAGEKNIIQSIANFAPPMDSPVGYDYENGTHNNDISFGDTESAAYKTYHNMIKWTNTNDLSFPDMNYREIDEPVHGLIAAPSFLKMQYQNTVLIYSRNMIHRLVFSGSPADWRTGAGNLIAEKTQYGLLADNTLVKVGNTLFWLSEAGIIRWSPEGLIPISDPLISINHPLSEQQKMIAFYCPVRNQVLFHTQYKSGA